MRVLLTGATGFVGLNIVQSLVRAGHELTCLVRPNARRKWLDQWDVHCEVAEFSDGTRLRKLFRGVEAVIHTAGNTSCSWRDIRTLEQANVESTRAVLDAAKASDVRRIVYTSTTSTVGSFDDPRRAADESTPLQGPRARSPYAQTKRQAEQILLARTDGPECVILNPAEVVGPYDHSLQWGRIAVATAHGQLPFLPPGSGCFCPAEDVANAHVAALNQGVPGKRYLLGGHNVPFADFIAQVADELHCPVRPRETLPYPLLIWKAQLREWLSPWVDAPPVDAYRMRVFARHHLFDDSLARRELGYTTRPLRDAIAQCVAWYRENGFLPSAPTTEAARPLTQQESKVA